MAKMRQQPAPSTLRKAKRENAMYSLSNGDRVPNDTGFIVPGATTKSYETFYELMMPGTTSAMLRHPTKARTYRVLEGQGYFYHKASPEAEATHKYIMGGHEFTVEAGAVFSVSTTTESALHLHVCQDSKFDAKLEKLTDAAVINEFNIAAVGYLDNEAVVPSGPRYSTRAASLSAAARGQEYQERDREAAVVDSLASGINARPINHFSEDDAG